ncbi:exopolysaccharide biosynthesis polyprenyl glycosylphosphotransferase [Belnapia sp. T6]|uniref:Exopolysaccharide biosynthesis polyprenyl glycosylphosphotransferase n=1 Tax=Belnapia mucosa TaxID=2804532 RepID=A0ABS1V5D9_9PROT|nr:exopolysaccharide biosynthesis polyprenyl glycosylphosphotransferase [Belnapia mucosa]MBL6455929.1 exopolysaccharide biosynthesis polyprenyl glycosylphosphotransferase [Belnapia mucosa]
MPPKPHAAERRLMPAVAELGWGRFADEARGAHPALPLQAPLSPVLLATLVALLDGMAVVLAGVALQALPMPSGRPEPALIGFLAVLVPCMIAALGGYQHSSLYGNRRAALATLAGLVLGGGGLALAATVLGAHNSFPPGLALVWLAMATAPLLCGRLAAGLALRAAAERTRQRAVVVGDGPQAARFVAALRGRQDRSIELIGMVDDRRAQHTGGQRNGLPYLGSIEALGAMIRRGEVDQVILALPWAAEARMQALLRHFADYPVDVRLAPDLMAYRSPGLSGPEAERLRLLRLADRPIRGWGAAVKAIEDYSLAVLALAICAVPMLLIALAVKLDSPGPVLFRQRRTGFNDQPFYVLKFRTMYQEKLDYTVAQQVRAGDSRVTRVGAVLRRTSLDELPQILNIIRGEMSFIGPRPHAPGTRAGGRPFEEVAARYAARHRVKPGLTGLAQVRGWRGPTETEDKLLRRVESDLEYIDTWSPWLDFTILVRTLLAVVRMKNAC